MHARSVVTSSTYTKGGFLGTRSLKDTSIFLSSISRYLDIKINILIIKKEIKMFKIINLNKLFLKIKSINRRLTNVSFPFGLTKIHM